MFHEEKYSDKLNLTKEKINAQHFSRRKLKVQQVSLEKIKIQRVSRRNNQHTSSSMNKNST